VRADPGAQRARCETLRMSGAALARRRVHL
jgi:hypothetical protein